MKYKLRNEDRLLDQNFRKQIIQEIKGSENVQRKNEALRAYEMFKGRTKKWVIELLSREFEPETVAQMENRSTNYPVLKKVVKKLAQTYTAGVDRKVDTEGEGENTEAQSAVDDIAKAVDLDSVQEKTDKFFELFLNVLVQVVPVVEIEEGEEKYRLDLRVLAPHFFDVIPDADDPTKPRCVILTDFVERNAQAVQQVSTRADGRLPGVVSNFSSGDGQQQTIAEPNGDDDGRQKREFIFWSQKYHFTCDEQGRILPEQSGEGNLNPIGRLPFVHYAGDQDGQFFAEGWQDRVDGALHINVVATDMFCIAMVQGWGQPVLVGEKLPEKVVGGPHRAIVLKAKEGSPEPKFYYESSNPPLDQWLSIIEMDVALYLSNNDLSPSTVSSKLDAKNLASGIAMLIERSESTQDIQQKQKMFVRGENETFQLIQLWRDALGETQCDELKALPTLNLENEVMLTFRESKPVVSEQEHVKTLSDRKTLGLNTLKDLIKRDNPGMSDEQADQKLTEIMDERTKFREMFALPGQDPNAGEGDGSGDKGGAPPVKGKPGAKEEATKVKENK